VVSTPVDPAEYGLEDSIVAPSTLYATSCEGTCRQTRNGRRRRRMRANNNSTSRRVSRANRSGNGNSNSNNNGNGNRGRRRGRKVACQPTESRALDVWYFDQQQQLAYASLPGMVITKCGCTRQ
jgi:hypothetical protein